MNRRDEIERESLPRRLKITAVALACALAALVVATVLFARQSALVRVATAEEMALNDWQAQLQSVLVYLIDAETGQRGYLLTGDARYLAPYNAAIHEIPLSLDALRAVPISDPSLAGHLRDIAQAASSKIAELTETIRLREAGAMLDALALMRTDAGRKNMVRIRGDVKAVSDIVAVHREAMSERVIRGSLKTQRLAVLTAGALVAVILLAGIEIWILLSARARQTRALKELAEVFDHTPDFVAQADWLGKMIYLNPAARRALRLAAHVDVKGRAFTEFFTDETNKRWLPEIIPTAKREGLWLGETAVRLPRGAVPVNHMVIAHHGTLGRVVRYTSIMRDISEQVTTRAELARQTATLDAIVESIPAIVVVWDVNLRYRLVNREFERSRGRREDFIGLTFEEAWGARGIRAQPPVAAQGARRRDRVLRKGLPAGKRIAARPCDIHAPAPGKRHGGRRDRHRPGHHHASGREPASYAAQRERPVDGSHESTRDSRPTSKRRSAMARGRRSAFFTSTWIISSRSTTVTGMRPAMKSCASSLRACKASSARPMRSRDSVATSLQ